MRLECSILAHPANCNPKAIGKPAKGFVCIGKGKLKPSNGTFQLQISTAKARNQPAISLSPGNIVKMLTTFSAQGKVSLQFASPASHVFISGANAERLGRFIQIIKQIQKGEEVNLHEINKVTSTDFQQQKTLKLVECKTYHSDYAKTFPTTIVDLSLVKCGLSRVDVRWFSCANLVKMDLSHNTIGNVLAELNKFKLLPKLKMLKSVDLSHNQLETLPVTVAFPESLLELNLSDNKLTRIPLGICGARGLTTLKIANNPIEAFPNTRCWPHLRKLDISGTLVSIFPYYVTQWRLESLSCSDIGNEVPAELLQTLEFAEVKPPSLQGAAAAIVKRHGLNEEILPWTVRMWMGRMAAECSLCRRFVAHSLLLPSIVQKNPMTLANQVDTHRDLSLLLYRCPVCVKRQLRP